MNTIVRDAPNPVSVLRNELQNMDGQFKAALPAHIPVERFMRVVMTALQNNSDLVTKVDRKSLWNAAIKAAQDGLLPDGREGAIVAFGTQAQWMPMIAGIRKKVRNSGEIATWEVHVVHQDDEFEFALGDDPFIKHRPDLSADSGSIIAAYSIATLKSGEKSREVMSVSDIEKVHKRSRAANSGPWVTDYGEMCRKTVARRHSKVLPMSTDLDDLMRRDDELYDMEAAKNEARATQAHTLSKRLDVLAQIPGKVETVNPDTGEITDTNDTSASTQPAPSQPGAPSNAPAPSQGAPESHVANHVGTTGAPEALVPGPAAAAYIEEWDIYIACLADADAGEKHWKSEKGLRNKLNVDPDDRDRLAEKLGAKIAALRNKYNPNSNAEPASHGETRR